MIFYSNPVRTQLRSAGSSTCWQPSCLGCQSDLIRFRGGGAEMEIDRMEESREGQGGI